MRLKTETIKAELCSAVIDEFSEHARGFLSGIGKSNTDVIRYCMSLEEIMLSTREACGDGLPVSLTTGSRYSRPYIQLEIDGQPINVYSSLDSSQGVLGSGLLKNLGLSPYYSFSDHKNSYLFKLKKKRINPFIALLLTIAAAFVVGFCGLLPPASVRDAILNTLFDPLYDTFLNMLGCAAGPMIFLSVAWGIYGIGDAATLKRIGKKMLGKYSLIVILSAVACFFICLPLFSLHFSSAVGVSSDLSSIVSMVLGIVPKNIFSPFVDGNSLQIIFLAFLFGIAMMFLSQKTTVVAEVVEQINYIVQFLIELISRLVPYFIFIVIVHMIWSGDLKQFAGLGKLFAIFAITSVLMLVALLLYTSRKNRVSFSLLVKKSFPGFITALTTASSAAAFGTNLKICREQYGIHDSITAFALPLGIATFKPTTSMFYVIVSLFFAEKYGIEVSVGWIIILLFSSVILSFALPPIPGGALASYSALFLQLGFPAEALAIALSCDMLIDFICTGCDQLAMPLALLDEASRIGMLDYDVLRKEVG